MLVEQFRPGTHSIIKDVIGGVVEEGEDVEEAAQRELLEETGYQGRLVSLFNYNVCAYSTQRRHCFIALACKEVSEQELDTTEFIETDLMPLEDFHTFLLEGDLTDSACGFAALDYLRRTGSLA